MENFFISEEAHVGPRVSERLELLHRRNNATIFIEKNAKISDEVIFSDVLQSLFIGQYTSIGKRTFFAFKRINIGPHCSILAGMYFGKRQMDTFVPGIQKGRMSTFDQLTIGIGAHIYGDSEIYALNVTFGNFLRMNSRVKIDGYNDFSAGHNVWVGRDTALNATGGLEIGNNTGIGEKCLIWSHGYWSDLLEGSNIFTVKKTVIGDECWIAAGASITPGVKVANRVLMLPESNVVKSIEEENVVVGGNPAKKIQKIVGGQTIDLAHFSPKSREEKYDYLKQVLSYFCRRFQKVDLTENLYYARWDVWQGNYSGRLVLLLNENKDDEVVDFLSPLAEHKEILVFSPHYIGSDDFTNFNYMTRKHSSLLKKDGSYNLLALEFIKDSNTYIAKFIPQDGFYKQW